MLMSMVDGLGRFDAITEKRFEYC